MKGFNPKHNQNAICSNYSKQNSASIMKSQTTNSKSPHNQHKDFIDELEIF
jgi:hypothetical protein